ncbi:MAG TPA: tetratricopeptide repeat protein [Thermoanaerobaculia bacterium]|nr:tetratricopeptide repeat protein [Thermoanaerobaculia bacterium]
MNRLRSARVFAIAFSLAAAAAVASPAGAPSSPALDYMQARLAANAGDYDTALRLMERLVEREPANPVLLFERARTLVDAQRIPRAESELRKLVALAPDFYDANRLLGRLLVDRSGGSPAKLDEGLKYLQKAYTLAPDDLSTGMMIAQLLAVSERWAEAEAVMSTVVERAPDNPSAAFTYAKILTKLGREKDATEFLERTAEADPTFVPAVMQLVESYEKQREWLKAAELLTPLVEQDPQNRDLQRQQAFFYLRGGKPAEAKALVEPLAEDSRDTGARFLLAEALAELREFDKAEPIYRRLIQHDPNNVDYLVSFGLTQMAMRDYEGAAATFKAILAVEAASDGSKRLARTQLSAIDHHRGRYDESLAQALEIAEASDRLNPQAINIALDVYRRRQQWPEGVALIDRLVAKYGEEPYLQARLLEFLLSGGESERADEIAKKIEARENGNSMLAEVYIQAKQYPKAIAILEQLRAKTPDDVGVLFQLGAAFERAEKIEESEAAFQRVLALKADHAPTLNYLGYMWADRGVNLDKAAAMLEKAVASDPDNGAYLDSLGWAYFRLGKLDLAKTYLGKAADVVPDDPTIQEHLGDLALKLGDAARALNHYRAALDLDPEPKEEETIRVKIAELEKR